MRKDLFKGVVLGAVVSTVVMMAGTALAGTSIGGFLHLGVVNRASAPTTLTAGTTGKALQLTNTKGPALGLTVPTGKPPLTVSSSTLVPHLNSDRVDGLHASSLVRKGGVGSVAVAARWYGSVLPNSPTWTQPNRYAGEVGYATNGGKLWMTRMGPGWYRMKVDPALPGGEYLLFANADMAGPQARYAQGVMAADGPVWDIYIHDKNGDPADTYAIEVTLIRAF